MRWMGMLALLVAVAAADNGPAAQVRKLWEEGKPVEAVRLAGGWAADAQRRADLIEEEAAWRSLCDIRVPLEANPGDTVVVAKGRGLEVPLDDTRYRDACAEVMKLLDPKRNGAYLSAHLLAVEIVCAAIREGDDRHLADAAAILRAPRKDAGACATTFAELGAGVLAARKEEESASSHLTTAFDAALTNGWLDLAAHAGIELACADKKRGREGDTLKRLDEALKENGDRSLLQLRNALAAKRIPDAVIDIGGGSVAAAGGRGGKGGPAESAIGVAWKTHPAAKALLTVRRGAKGFEIEPRFGGAKEDERAFDTGVRHWDSGGLTLSFCGPGVALAMVDLTGRRGQPGESSQAGPWQLFYLLAPGETWSVTKKGVVTVGR